MPVNVLTPSTVSQVPTGLGGNLDFPENYNDSLRGAGSLRITEDGTLTEPFAASDLSSSGSLRPFEDVTFDFASGGANLTGSPNYGDV